MNDDKRPVVEDVEIDSSTQVTNNIPKIDDTTDTVPDYVSTISVPPRVTVAPTISDDEDNVVLNEIKDLLPDEVSETDQVDTMEFVSSDGGSDDHDEIMDAIYGSNSLDEDDINAKDIKIVIPLSNSRELTDALVEKGRLKGPDKFLEALKDVNSDEATIRDSLEYFTANTKLGREHLEATKDRNKKHLSEVLSQAVDGISTKVTSGGIPEKLSKKGKVLSGSVASMTITAMMQGLKSIPLWNSGFYITIRTPNMPELAQFFHTVNTQEYEYGRELGVYYFLFADNEVKQLVLETILPQVLVGSNFVDWKDSDKLLKMISIHDYQTILWGMASMIYKDGFNIKLPCSDNGRCHEVTEAKIDVGHLRQIDTTKIPNDAISFMKNRNAKRTATELLKYRSILAKPGIIRIKSHHPSTDTTTYWHFNLKDANCFDVTSLGSILNDTLFRSIHKSKPNANDVQEFLTVNYYKSYLPWIDSITCVTESGYEKDELEDEDIIFIVKNTSLEDREMFNSFLDIVQMEDKDFGKEILDYIESTRITHFVLPVDKCPHCGKEPDTSVDGFIPLDMQTLFFRISLMRMLNAG